MSALADRLDRLRRRMAAPLPSVPRIPLQRPLITLQAPNPAPEPVASCRAVLEVGIAPEPAHRNATHDAEEPTGFWDFLQEEDVTGGTGEEMESPAPVARFHTLPPAAVREPDAWLAGRPYLRGRGGVLEPMPDPGARPMPEAQERPARPHWGSTHT